MAEPFPYPKKPLKRGKVLSAADLERLGGFARYKDVDGDGIGYRTLPGTKHPLAAYFTRGSGHNEKAAYTERPDDYIRNMDRLARKFETARAMVPQPVIEETAGARVGVIGAGTTHWALVESRDQLQREFGIPSSYMRLRAFPFGRELAEFITRHDRVYVVEQNRDAQLLDLIRLEVGPRLDNNLRSVRYYGGLPIDARTVTDDIVQQEEL
jgi:2-oxoglutarate ferredoxin oxidoreductase subunit alpha